MNKKNFTFGLITALLAIPVLAQEGAPVSAATASTVASVFGQAGGWMAMASGLGIAIAAMGGALGQGRAAAAALDGVARNPAASGKLTLPLILSLALIESLVIYALIISFQLTASIQKAVDVITAGH